MDRNLLLTLEKPGRYVGGELNSVVKTGDMTRFALCFPDVYEIGMSHLGLQILYFLLNARDDVACERAFMPWFDMRELLMREKQPLYALESGDGLAGFHFVGFTLQYEMAYTNVLAMLDLADIPLLSRDRGDGHPIVCAGGPCATNPQPMADFIDFFFIGDAEAGLNEIMDVWGEKKHTRSGFLRAIAHMPGVYVPAVYDEAPYTVKRAVAADLSFFPTTLITPLIEAVHDRAVLEPARGCMRGCRFCQAGYIYRPMRQRGVGDLLAQAAQILESTGHEEISLLALSVCDFTQFEALVDGLCALTDEKKVNISLPSTRLDALPVLEKIKSVRKSSLTVAPEAGSQRLRDAINKGLSEQEIIDGCYRAFTAGYDKIKLYFMSGLPGETDEDRDEILRLCDDIVSAYYRLPYEARTRPVGVSVSTACFVPKAHTPLQWAAQIPPECFADEQRELKARVKNKRVTYRYHDAKTAQIEGLLARGGRNTGAVIMKAYESGCIFDGWTEHFSYDKWTDACRHAGIDLHHEVHRRRDENEPLPWDFIDMGVTKAFLLREWQKSQAAQTTPNCRENCAGCGIEVCHA
jgi:radical SAM family uncharacterized protein